MEAQECGVPAPYTAPDIAALMGRWETKTYHEPFSIGDFQIEFYDAGHILGSASIRISDSTTAIVFSGDLGNSPAPLIKPTEPIEGVQYALIESAYGGRIHEAVASRTEKLERVIEETVKDGGTLMIPAFALERTQSLLYELNELVKRGRIPSIPIFLDSPLAIALTPIYQKYATNPLYFSRTAIAHGTEHDLFNFPGLRMTRTPAESRQIAKVSGPKVIIAGAGMSNGGRIVRHEARYLSDPKNTILFIGYQATRSRGRQILEGADTVEIDGKEIPVRCRRVEIGGYSAHADQPQLLKWLEPMRHTVQNVFIVQGEEEAAAALAQKARDELAIRATVPSPGDTVEL
jgi:metallo-beta-lactamase family protein